MFPVTATAGAPLAWPPHLLTAHERARFARYAEALAFFEGGQWLGRPRRGEPRLTFNYARAVLRKTAAYVFPAPATFSVPAGAGDDQRHDEEIRSSAAAS